MQREGSHSRAPPQHSSPNGSSSSLGISAITSVSELRQLIDTDAFRVAVQRSRRSLGSQRDRLGALDAIAPLLALHERIPASSSNTSSGGQQQQQQRDPLLDALSADVRVASALLDALPVSLADPTEKQLQQVWGILLHIACQCEPDSDVFFAVASGTARRFRCGINECVYLQREVIPASDNESNGSSSNNDTEDKSATATSVRFADPLDALFLDARQPGPLSNLYADAFVAQPIEIGAGGELVLPDFSLIAAVDKRCQLLLHRLRFIGGKFLEMVRRFDTAVAAAPLPLHDSDRIRRRLAAYRRLAPEIMSPLLVSQTAMDELVASTSIFQFTVASSQESLLLMRNEICAMSQQLEAKAAATSGGAPADDVAQEQQDLEQAQQQYNVYDARYMFVCKILTLKRKLARELQSKACMRLEPSVVTFGSVMCFAAPSGDNGKKTLVISVTERLACAATAFAMPARRPDDDFQQQLLKQRTMATAAAEEDDGADARCATHFAGDESSPVSNAVRQATSDMSARLCCVAAFLRDAAPVLAAMDASEFDLGGILAPSTVPSSCNSNSNSMVLLFRAMLEMLPGYTAWAPPSPSDASVPHQDDSAADLTSSSAALLMRSAPGFPSDALLADCFCAQAVIRHDPEFLACAAASPDSAPSRSSNNSPSRPAGAATAAAARSGGAGGGAMATIGPDEENSMRLLIKPIADHDGKLADNFLAEKWATTARRCLAAITELATTTTTSAQASPADQPDALLDEVGALLIASVAGDAGWYLRVHPVAAERASTLWAVACKLLCPPTAAAPGADEQPAASDDNSHVMAAWLHGLGVVCCEAAAAEAIARQQRAASNNDDRRRARRNSAVDGSSSPLTITSNLFPWAASVFAGISTVNTFLYGAVINALWEEFAFGRRSAASADGSPDTTAGKNGNAKSATSSFSSLTTTFGSGSTSTSLAAAVPELPAPDVVHFLAACTTDIAFDPYVNFVADKLWSRVDDFLARRLVPYGPEFLLLSVSSVTQSAQLASRAFDAATRALSNTYWAADSAVDAAVASGNNKNNNNGAGGNVNGSSSVALASRPYAEQAAVWSAAVLSACRILDRKRRRFESGASTSRASTGTQEMAAAQAAAKRALMQCLVPFARDALLHGDQCQLLHLRCRFLRGGSGAGGSASAAAAAVDLQQQQSTVVRLTAAVSSLLSLLGENVKNDFSRPEPEMQRLHAAALQMMSNLAGALDQDDTSSNSEDASTDQQQPPRSSVFPHYAGVTNWAIALLAQSLGNYLPLIRSGQEEISSASSSSAPVYFGGFENVLPKDLHHSLPPVSNALNGMSLIGQLQMYTVSAAVSPEIQSNADDGGGNESTVMRAVATQRSECANNSAAMAYLMQGRVDAVLASVNSLNRTAATAVGGNNGGVRADGAVVAEIRKAIAALSKLIAD